MGNPLLQVMHLAVTAFNNLSAVIDDTFPIDFAGLARIVDSDHNVLTTKRTAGASEEGGRLEGNVQPKKNSKEARLAREKQQIMELRYKHGLTQSAIANSLDIHPQKVSRLLKERAIGKTFNTSKQRLDQEQQTIEQAVETLIDDIKGPVKIADIIEQMKTSEF